MTSPVLRVAHRAGNDLTRLGLALAGGADLVEADVHLYRGRLEVRHAKSMGPLPWLWDQWYVVSAGTRGLSLPALAAELPPERRVMLDLKGWQPWLGRRVAAAMASVAPGLPYVVCSRHWSMLDAFDGLEHVDVVHSVRSRSELARLPRRLAARGRSWGVAVHRELLPRMDVQALRESVDAVLTWPVNTVEAFDEVVRLGATGVISDDLAAVAVRRA
jgi:glycerophosphoryl diester phosphodiesterase